MLQKPTYPRIQPAHFDAHVVLDMPFDEGAGDRVLDYSGHNNHGTLVNMEEADWVPGLGGRGWALQFDGANEYIIVANEPLFDFERTDPFTLSAWVKRGGVDGAIAGKGLDAASFRGYMLQLSGGRLLMSLLNSVAPALYTQVRGTTVLAAGTEYHVAAVNLGNTGAAADVRLYVNGVLETPVIIQDTLGANTILNDTPFSIAARQNGGIPWNAVIGRHVGVCNRALTASEVLRLYEQSRSRYRIG